MLQIEKTINDIKSLKIQGAISIAKEALFAIYKYSIKKNINIKDIQNMIGKLKSTRPTEPAMYNLLDIFLYKISKLHINNKKEINNIYTNINNTLNNETQNIIKNGVQFLLNFKKEKKSINIFTHCHSSTVVQIILEAYKHGKKINVYNTETRPRYQGRKTAYELSNAGIKVYHTIDNASHYFIKHCDIFLFGADAIDFDGSLYNKVGTYIYCELAKKYNVKTFSCTGLLKYNQNTTKNRNTIIEERDINEVWEENDNNFKRPNKNLCIFNPAFDKIPSKLIDGIICEHGIIKISKFIQTAKKLLKLPNS